MVIGRVLSLDVCERAAVHSNSARVPVSPPSAAVVARMCVRIYASVQIGIDFVGGDEHEHTHTHTHALAHTTHTRVRQTSERDAI